MSRGRHRLDGQRRDAIRAWARDTWTRARAWLSGDTYSWVRHPVASRLGWWNWPAPARRWLLRRWRRRRLAMTPAPGWKPGQDEPRPADPPRVGRGDEVRAGATTTPGAVNADGGTRQGPAGHDPRQPEAAPPPGAAAAPARFPTPGPGQPLPAWHGDYAPTQPFRAIPGAGRPRVSPYYQRHETLLDAPAVRIP